MTYPIGKRVYFTGNPGIGYNRLTTTRLHNHPVVIVYYDGPSDFYICTDIVGREVIAYGGELSEEKKDEHQDPER